MHEIETWVKQLQGSDLSLQISAAESLAGLDEAAQEAIVVLVQHCGSSDLELRNWCTAALEDVGRPIAGQIDELALLAGSASSDVAFWAATLLGRAGPVAIGAAPVLAQRSSDSSAPEVQRRAAWALKQIQAA